MLTTKPFIAMIFATLLGAECFAGSPFYSAQEMVDRYYDVVCGPAQSVPAEKDMIEARERFQAFLQNPHDEADRIVGESPVTENGILNLKVMCRSVNLFSGRLTKQYCLTDGNRAIRARRAILFCQGLEKEGSTVGLAVQRQVYHVPQ